MRITDLFNKRKITKTVDSGQQGLTESKKVSSEIPKTEVVATSVAVTIEDIEEKAASLISTSYALIEEIKQVNGYDPEFSQYAKLLEESFVDPTNIKLSSVIPIPEYQKIDLLEKSVYKNIQDPRAPFLQDIYGVISEAGIVRYVLENSWKEFKDSIVSDPVRLTLQADNYKIDYLGNYIAKIKTNTYQRLGQDFVTSLLRKTSYNRETEGQDFEATLDYMEKLAQISLIDTHASWTMLSSIIRRNSYDVMKNIWDKLIRSQSYKTAATYQDGVIDFLNSIERELGIDDLHLSEIQNFKNQILTTITSEAAKIEDDMIESVSEINDKETQRYLLLENSRKASKIKEYRRILQQLKQQ